MKRRSKATVAGTEDDPDLHSVRPPRGVYISGFSQVHKAYTDGTDEMRNALRNECEMIFECRVCRNIYRSMLNFLCHKRVYCEPRFGGKVTMPFDETLDPDLAVRVDQRCTRIVQMEQEFASARPTTASGVPGSLRDLSSVIERLRVQQKMRAEDAKNDDSRRSVPANRPDGSLGNALKDANGNLQKIRALDAIVACVPANAGCGELPDERCEPVAAIEPIAEQNEDDLDASGKAAESAVQEVKHSEAEPNADKPKIDEQMLVDVQGASDDSEIVLQLDQIPSNGAAVFQTVRTVNSDAIDSGALASADNMRQQVNELAYLSENAPNVVLNADNVAVPADSGTAGTSSGRSKTHAEPTIACTICKMLFKSKGMLRLHMRLHHDSAAMVYPCTSCSQSFLRPFGLIRHLSMDHKKSIRRIQMMRDSLLRRSTQRSQIPVKPVRSLPSTAKPKKATWSDNYNGIMSRAALIEQNGLPRSRRNSKAGAPTPAQVSSSCMHCGRTFERRAALSTHMKACAVKQGQPGAVAVPPTAAGGAFDSFESMLQREKAAHAQVRSEEAQLLLQEQSHKAEQALRQPIECEPQSDEAITPFSGWSSEQLSPLPERMRKLSLGSNSQPDSDTPFEFASDVPDRVADAKSQAGDAVGGSPLREHPEPTAKQMERTGTRPVLAENRLLLIAEGEPVAVRDCNGSSTVTTAEEFEQHFQLQTAGARSPATGDLVLPVLRPSDIPELDFDLPELGEFQLARSAETSGDASRNTSATNSKASSPLPVKTHKRRGRPKGSGTKAAKRRSLAKAGSNTGDPFPDTIVVPAPVLLSTIMDDYSTSTMRSALSDSDVPARGRPPARTAPASTGESGVKLVRIPSGTSTSSDQATSGPPSPSASGSRRPIRKRVRNNKKDFVYDLSGLMKMDHDVRHYPTILKRSQQRQKQIAAAAPAAEAQAVETPAVPADEPTNAQAMDYLFGPVLNNGYAIGEDGSQPNGEDADASERAPAEPSGSALDLDVSYAGNAQRMASEAVKRHSATYDRRPAKQTIVALRRSVGSDWQVINKSSAQPAAADTDTPLGSLAALCESTVDRPPLEPSKLRDTLMDDYHSVSKSFVVPPRKRYRNEARPPTPQPAASSGDPLAGGALLELALACAVSDPVDTTQASEAEPAVAFADDALPPSANGAPAEAASARGEPPQLVPIFGYGEHEPAGCGYGPSQQRSPSPFAPAYFDPQLDAGCFRPLLLQNEYQAAAWHSLNTELQMDGDEEEPYQQAYRYQFPNPTQTDEIVAGGQSLGETAQFGQQESADGGRNDGASTGGVRVIGPDDRQT